MKPTDHTYLVTGSFVSALAILVIIGVLSVSNARSLLKANRMTTNSHEVILSFERTLSTLKDAETGVRGFVITGLPAYLEPYNTAIQQIGPRIEGLYKMARINDKSCRCPSESVAPRSMTL